jgi:hypothetical protein
MIFESTNFNLFLGLIKFRWSSFTLYAIASVMSVSLRLKGLALEERFFIASISLGLLITFCTALILIIGFRFIRNFRVRVPWLVLPMLLFAGALRGAILHFEIDAFGYENKISMWASVISSTFYTAIYYSGASLFIELRNRRKNQFQAEFQRATLLRLGVQGFSEASDAKDEYQSSMNAIKEAIQLHLPISNNYLPNTDQVAKVASEIREQIQLVIRPLSHRLYIGTMGEIKTVGNGRLLVDTLHDLAIPAKFILAYQFSVGLFGIGISIGFANGMAKILPAMLGTYFSFLILNSLRKVASLPWQFRTTIFLISLMFAPIVFSEVFSGIMGIEVNWLAAFIISPTLPIVVVISSLVLLVARDRKFAIAAVQSVAIKQYNNQSDFTNEISNLELSGYLHNNLQSELLRIAQRLDTSNSHDGESTRGILGELNSALERSISDVQAIRELGLARVNALPLAWQGIAQIELDFNIQKPISREKERILSGFLEETITNSIRYGGATKLDIRIDSYTELNIVIAHNGDGSIHAGNGLGAIWLSQISQSKPLISKKHGQTSIRFTL